MFAFAWLFLGYPNSFSKYCNKFGNFGDFAHSQPRSAGSSAIDSQNDSLLSNGPRDGSPPRRFYELAGIPVHPGMDCSDSDFASCDLLIVMGTSLVVQPFASLIDQVCVCARASDSLRARVTLGNSQTLRGPSRTPIVTAAVWHRQKAPNLTHPHSRRCRRTARACC